MIKLKYLKLLIKLSIYPYHFKNMEIEEDLHFHDMITL